MSTVQTRRSDTREAPAATRERPRRHQRRTPAETAGLVFVYALLAVLIIPVLFPLYYAAIGTFMSVRELATFPPKLFPSSFTFDNLISVNGAINLDRLYLNSVVMAGVITVSQLATSVLAAYAFVFLPLPKRGVVFALFLSTLMIPHEATFIPNYLMISGWGLDNTYPGLVMPFLAAAFGTFLLRQSFKQFPRELRDAALIDGMGHLRFITRILVPLSKPTLMAVSLYVFLTTWNMYFWPLIITDDPAMRTLQIGLNSLKSAEFANPGLILAGAFVSVIPTLLLVVFGQRFIVRGLTAGAVK